MEIEELESYLGKYVKATFFNNRETKGTLEKGKFGIFDKKRDYRINNDDGYFEFGRTFDLSHIKHIEEIKEEKIMETKKVLISVSLLEKWKKLLEMQGCDSKHMVIMDIQQFLENNKELK